MWKADTAHRSRVSHGCVSEYLPLADRMLPIFSFSSWTATPACHRRARNCAILQGELNAGRRDHHRCQLESQTIPEFEPWTTLYVQTRDKCGIFVSKAASRACRYPRGVMISRSRVALHNSYTLPSLSILSSSPVWYAI